MQISHKKLLHIFGGIALTFVAVIVGFLIYVHIKLDDEMLTKDVRDLLADVLQTDVRLDKCSLSPLTQGLNIYGLNIKDHQNVDMLHIDTLEISVDILDLLDNKLLVYGFNLSGAHAILYKERKDTAANYQFAVDALTFITDKNKKSVKHEKKEKKTLMVNLQECRIENTSVKWDVKSEEQRNTATFKVFDPNHIDVENFGLSMKLEGGGQPGNFIGTLNNLYAQEKNSMTEIQIKGIDFNGPKKSSILKNAMFKYQDKQLSLKNLSLKNINGNRELNLENLQLKIDNHKPRKNADRPNIGAFDPGHVNLELTLNATASYLSVDSVSMHINSISGVEHESGLQLSKITMDVSKASERCHVTNMRLIDKSTVVQASLVDIILPSKKHAREFSLVSKNVRAHVLLKDIAQPFAPILSKFTTPLELSTDVSGNQEGLKFSNTHVYTTDGRLDIFANGFINFGKKSMGTKTALGFNVSFMQTRSGIMAQILSYFSHLSPALVTLLTKVGDIKFTGTLQIPYHQEIIQGNLTTGAGVINTDIKLSLDQNHHQYLSGSVKSDGINLGKLTGNDDLGPVAFTTSFNLLLPKKNKGGKNKVMPVGTLTGTALKASYKFVTIKDIDFTINSDGNQVTGDISSNSKLLGVSADFSFQDADIKNTLKVHPHVSLNLFKSKKSSKKKQI